VRLFISCNIPDDLSDYLRSLALQLPETKQTIPQQFDLTIKFLGNVDENKLDEICQRLSQITFHPFETSLETVHVFSERFIKIVWVGLTEGDKFAHLHKQVEEALFPLFERDTRFQAHITIARIKSLKDKDAFLEALPKIQVKPVQFKVDRLILVESNLSAAGATHTPLHEYKAIEKQRRKRA
jgi:2'-5' RNA ligase